MDRPRQVDIGDAGVALQHREDAAIGGVERFGWHGVLLSAGRQWISCADHDAKRQPCASPMATRFPRSRTPTTLAAQRSRSEEHTSELQSLMPISYAVFCLKKKKSP